MKISLTVFLFAVSLVAAGCGGITRKDLDDSERRLEALIARNTAELERKVNAVDAKYASMLALEQQVKNGLGRIDQNAKLLEGANDVLAKLLQARRNSLKEELSRIENQIEVLQKPGGN
jgi:hypothetical protein